MERDNTNFYDKPISDNEVTKSCILTLFPKRFIFSITIFFGTLVIRLLISYHFVLVYKKFLLRIYLKLLDFVYCGKPSDETRYIPSNLIKL